MHIDSMTADQAKGFLHQLSDTLGIGKEVRTTSTLAINIENARRRSACLSRIEHIHVETEVDEETGERMDVPQLNWGDSPDRYEDRYRSVLASVTPLREARA